MEEFQIVAIDPFCQDGEPWTCDASAGETWCAEIATVGVLIAGALDGDYCDACADVVRVEFERESARELLEAA